MCWPAGSLPSAPAILLQVAFAVVAATVVTMSAPLHGADYGIVVYVVPITVVVSVAALYAGFLPRRRRVGA